MSAQTVVLEGSSSPPRAGRLPGAVEIFVPVEVETGADPGRRTISGRVGYQGCSENARLPPAGVGVEVDLEVVDEEERGHDDHDDA